MKIFNKDKKKNKNIVQDSQTIENTNPLIVDDSEVKKEEILVVGSEDLTNDFNKALNEKNEKDINESLLDLENNVKKENFDNLTDIDSAKINIDVESDETKLINDILIEAKIDLLPANFVIGYYEGMTMKGLKEYINGYVFKYFNAPNITSYKILKYNSGLIFEIHDGDYKKSYLNTVINEFNAGRNVVYIKTQNRIAKVIKNYNKIETYMLPEAENNNHPDAIFPEKATMKPIVTTAFGMVPFGLSIAFMGVTSLFLSYIFKTILGKEEDLSLQTYTMELPSSYIEKLPLATEIKYVDKVLYSQNTWTKEFKEIKTPKMIQAEKMDFALSKILAYQNFTNRCFTKSQSLDQCNDNNIFFDKADFSTDTLIKSVSMDKGLITVSLQDNESIKYLPEITGTNLLWKIECSSVDIANLCMAPNVIIKNNNNKNANPINETDKKLINEPKGMKENIEESQKMINPSIIQPIIKHENVKQNMKKENDTVKKSNTKKENNEKVHEIIKAVKTTDIIKTPKITEVNKTLKKIEDSAKPLENINNVEKSLNFNNLPDNVVVEKK
jgi:hypothetical protein